MGKLNLTIDNELEKQFREAAFKLNMKKGSLQQALEAAIKCWLEQQKQTKC